MIFVRHAVQRLVIFVLFANAGHGYVISEGLTENLSERFSNAKESIAEFLDLSARDHSLSSAPYEHLDQPGREKRATRNENVTYTIYNTPGGKVVLQINFTNEVNELEIQATRDLIVGVYRLLDMVINEVEIYINGSFHDRQVLTVATATTSTDDTTAKTATEPSATGTVTARTMTANVSTAVEATSSALPSSTTEDVATSSGDSSPDSTSTPEDSSSDSITTPVDSSSGGTSTPVVSASDSTSTAVVSSPDSTTSSATSPPAEVTASTLQMSTPSFADTTHSTVKALTMSTQRATFPTGSPATLAQSQATTTTTMLASDRSGLSDGAIAAAVLGSLFGVVVILLIIFWVIPRIRQARHSTSRYDLSGDVFHKFEHEVAM